MITKNDKKRWEKYLALKANPSLALLDVMEEMEAKLIKLVLVEIKKHKKVLDPQMEDLVAKALKGVLKQVRGKKGDQGEPGYTPVAGKDYWNDKQIKAEINRLVGFIPRPKDGYTPIRGKDYPTLKQIKAIVRVLVDAIPRPADGKPGPEGEPGPAGSPDTPKDIRNKLMRLKGEERLSASAIKDLDERVKERVVLLGGDRGRRVWPIYGETPSGTPNSTDGTDGTTTFSTVNDIKPDTDRVYVNGARQKRGSSNQYTISGHRNIVFTSGNYPRTGDEIEIDYEIDR